MPSFVLSTEDRGHRGDNTARFLPPGACLLLRLTADKAGGRPFQAVAIVGGLGCICGRERDVERPAWGGDVCLRSER